MTSNVVFEGEDGETQKIASDEDDDIVNIHVNEDKRAVVVKYRDRRQYIPLERVYHVLEYVDENSVV